MANFPSHPCPLPFIRQPLSILLAIISSTWAILPSESAAIPSPLVLPGSPACDAKNRDPCTNFPGLCSTGGGLCVFKGPCEYECVCPPDGRRGRGCTGNDDVITPPREEIREASNGGSLLDSLLVFPQDLFWDLNHVLRPEESVKMMQSTPPQYSYPGLSTTTTPSSSSYQTDSLEKISQNYTKVQSYNDLTNATLATFTNNTAEPALNQPLSVENQAKGASDDTLGFIVPQPTTQSSSRSTELTQGMTTNSPLTYAARQQPTSPSTTNPASKAITDNYNANNTITVKVSSYIVTTPPGNRENANNRSSRPAPPTTTEGRKRSPTPILRAKTDSIQLRSTTALPPPSPSATRISTSLNSVTTLTELTTGSLSMKEGRSTTLQPQPSSSASSSSSTSPSSSSSSPPTTTSPSRPTHDSFGIAITTTTSQRTISTTNEMNGLKLFGTTPNLTLSLPPANPRVVFSGDLSFPTFFSDVTKEKTVRDDGPPNMAVSKRVHRVFFPIAQFEKIERRRRVGGN